MPGRHFGGQSSVNIAFSITGRPMTLKFLVIKIWKYALLLNIRNKNCLQDLAIKKYGDKKYEKNPSCN